MDLAARLRRLCQIRHDWNETPRAATTKDTRVQALLTALADLKMALAQELLPAYFLPFTIDYSAGRGKPIQVPWLCVLGPGQRVQEGFYVAIAIAPDGRGAVVGLMKSATHPPDILLTTQKRTPLPDGALDVDSGLYRFNDAFHNPKEFLLETLDNTALLAHLKESLDKYQELLTEDQPEPIYRRRGRKPPARPTIIRESAYRYPPNRTDATALIPAWHRDLHAAGLHYEPAFLTRFLAALLAKPFVICAGLSGSGKTRLAQALGRWLGVPYRLIAVGPDWTTHDPLLGYPDALDRQHYQRTPTLDLLLAAAAQPTVPHLLILDELNLSPVERYFAAFLSAMESQEPLLLHGDPEPRAGVPSALAFPPNLVVIGTVNVDETTFGFSPKVLDRASVLEFRIDSADTLWATPPTSLQPLAGQGSAFAPLLLQPLPPLATTERTALQESIGTLFTLFQAHELPFGFRTRDELLRFAAAHRCLTGRWDHTTVIDAILYQKLLPRCNGSQRRLAPLLHALLALAADRWPLTQSKCQRLLHRLEADGFATFAES